MSATNLTLGIVIAIFSALTITLCTSIICASRERLARDRFDPRSDENLRAEALGQVRGEQ
jgi:hypothetical protein